MPPSGVTALVEFAEAQDARSAFKNLAYTMFMDQPLYLEWAPVNVFSREATTDEKTRPPEKAVDGSVAKDVDATTENLEEGSTQKKDENSNIEPEDGSVLFVKNLNFLTTSDVLKQVSCRSSLISHSGKRNRNIVNVF